MVKKILKVLILVPCWGRPQITEVTLHNLSLFKKEVSKQWKVQILVVLSPEDVHVQELIKYVDKYEFKKVFFQNYPIGNKINAGVNYAMEYFDFDYLMNFGSDDLIHSSIVKLYEQPLVDKALFFGVNNLYFYEWITGETFHFHTYNDAKAIGAGRMISRHILEILRYKEEDLYAPECCMGLDGNSARNLKHSLGIKETVIDADFFPFIVDIKSDTNINIMMRVVTGRQHLITNVPTDYLHSYYPHSAKKLQNSVQIVG